MNSVNGRPNENRRVVIVEDSKTMQAVLDQIFSLRLGLDVVGIASDAQSAASMVRTLRPDLVTIDLCMPYIDGGRLLDMIADVSDVCKIIISGTACDNVEMVAKLKKAGADACVSKLDMSRDPDAFCGRVLSVLARTKLVASRPAAGRTITVKPAPRSITGKAGSYPVPLDEKTRLAVLAKLRLANDSVDRQLDLLTAHMGTTTDYPTCLITFLDQDTQWIKSAYGQPRGSTPRGLAFCNYTLCAEESFVVTNAATDPRFASHPYVVDEPRIRTYVGCPITSDEGVRIGAICLVDTKPRRISADVVANLKSISKIAAEIIRTRICASPGSHVPTTTALPKGEYQVNQNRAANGVR